MFRTCALACALTLCSWGCDGDGEETMDMGIAPDMGEFIPDDMGASDTGEADAGEVEEIAITGIYIDNFGTPHTIEPTTWTMGTAPEQSIFHLVMINNFKTMAIAENDADNAFSAGLFSRFDWVWDDNDTLFFCQTAYDAPTAEAAAEAEADSSDPANGGCGMFPWSRLSPPLAIIGNYSDGAGSHAITQQSWTQTYEGSDPLVFNIVEFDNDDEYVLAQNAEMNAFNPGLYSRFDWVMDGEQLWYCQSAFDAASLEDARMASADPSDPANGGCGMFPWSALSPE